MGQAPAMAVAGGGCKPAKTLDAGMKTSAPLLREVLRVARLRLKVRVLGNLGASGSQRNLGGFWAALQAVPGVLRSGARGARIVH
jgi:hypothetical protein